MKKHYFLHILSLLIFGTNGIIAGHIGLSSYEIVFLRTLFGSLFLGVFCLLGRQKAQGRHYPKDLLAVVISGIAMGTSWMFLYEAFAQIGVSLATLLYNCGPVVVVALSPLLFREKLTPNKVGGFICVLGGFVLINGLLFTVDGNLFGAFCGAASALTYAVMVIANKKATHISGRENTLLQLFTACVTVGIFVLCRNGLRMVIAPADWLWILCLGLINTGLACLMYFSTIGHLPAQSVSILGYLESLSALLFSALFLHERLSPLQIVGAVLILGGAMIGECTGQKQNKAKNT